MLPGTFLPKYFHSTPVPSPSSLLAVSDQPPRGCDCIQARKIALHVGGNAVAPEGVLRHVHPLGDSPRRCLADGGADTSLSVYVYVSGGTCPWLFFIVVTEQKKTGNIHGMDSSVHDHDAGREADDPSPHSRRMCGAKPRIHCDSCHFSMLSCPA